MPSSEEIARKQLLHKRDLLREIIEDLERAPDSIEAALRFVLRLFGLFEKIVAHSTAYPKYLDGRFFLSTPIANDAVQSALADIGALLATWRRIYGDSKLHKPDRHKYAAYLARWIAIRRPIQLAQDLPGRQEHPAQVYTLNAAFARLCLASLLRLRLSAAAAKHIEVCLHNNTVDCRTLSLIAFLCERVSERRQQIDEQDKTEASKGAATSGHPDQ